MTRQCPPRQDLCCESKFLIVVVIICNYWFEPCFDSRRSSTDSPQCVQLSVDSITPPSKEVFRTRLLYLRLSAFLSPDLHRWRLLLLRERASYSSPPFIGMRIKTPFGGGDGIRTRVRTSYLHCFYEYVYSSAATTPIAFRSSCSPDILNIRPSGIITVNCLRSSRKPCTPGYLG